MPFRRVAKSADLETLHRESLHDPDATNRLLEQRGHIGHPLLRAMRGAAQAAAEMSDRIDEDRSNDDRDERELRTRPEDVAEQKEQRERFLEEIAHARRDRGLNGVGV